MVVGDARDAGRGAGARGRAASPSAAEARGVFADALPVLDLPLSAPVVAGQPVAARPRRS